MHTFKLIIFVTLGFIELNSAENTPLEWRSIGWGACSRSCGEGERTSIPACSTGDDDDCAELTLILHTEKCNLGPCAEWESIGWTDCDPSCGDGERHSTYRCSTGNDEDCSEMTLILHTEKCNLGPCATWEVDGWSECSRSCGEGKRHSTSYTCSTGKEEDCAELSLYTQTETCNLGECTWKEAGWSDCSESCGEGQKSKLFACSSGNLDDCAELPLPEPLFVACNQGPCGQWVQGAFGQCDVTCGKGTQTAVFSCTTGKDSDCKTARPHAITRECNRGECPSQIPLLDKWSFNDFDEEDMTGTLQRFYGMYQESRMYNIRDVAIVNVEGKEGSMVFANMTLFPGTPIKRDLKFMMECSKDDCSTVLPLGQTIDACDMWGFASAAANKGGPPSTSMMGKAKDHIFSHVDDIFGENFASNAVSFIENVQKSKNYIFDNWNDGEDAADDASDFGGGCESAANKISTGLEWLQEKTSDNKETIDFRGIITELQEFLEASLGQLTFQVDLLVSSPIFTNEELLENGNLAIQVKPDSMHLIIDNGDQCTGNILCAVSVVLGEAFPSKRDREDSILGCVKLDFEMALNGADWRNGKGFKFRCLKHATFHDLSEAIMKRVKKLWKSLKTVPGLRHYGEHRHLCFADSACKETDDICVRGLCRTKQENDRKCWRDEDCYSGVCAYPGYCKPRRAVGEVCDHNSDCASQYCSNMYLCSDRTVGNPCLLDADCLSGRCSGGLCKAPAEDGTICDNHSDCASHYCSWAYRCSDRANGKMCVRDDDCTSGRCHLGTCHDLAADGSLCDSHSDCQSKYCSHLYKCSDRKFGKACLRNSDCLSKRCSGGKCRHRASQGTICDEHSDCKSNYCSSLWQCSDKKRGRACMRDKDCESKKCQLFQCK